MIKAPHHRSAPLLSPTVTEGCLYRLSNPPLDGYALPCASSAPYVREVAFEAESLLEAVTKSRQSSEYLRAASTMTYDSRSGFRRMRRKLRLRCYDLPQHTQYCADDLSGDQQPVCGVSARTLQRPRNQIFPGK